MLLRWPKLVTEKSINGEARPRKIKLGLLDYFLNFSRYPMNKPDNEKIAIEITPAIT